MQPVLNVEDVRKVERALTREGVSVSELMHRAGNAAAQEVMRVSALGAVCVLCGTGNNGGDGWVAAEDLLIAGREVVVVSPVAPHEIRSSLANAVANSAVSAGVPVVVGPSREELQELLKGVDVVLDAMLGTGYHGEPRPPFDMWIECVNQSGLSVIAIDVPSGLSAQTGHARGGCVLADETITMISLKPGLLADEGRDACGSIVLAPLAEQSDRLVIEADPVAWRVETADYVEVMPTPTLNCDKYSRGSVLVVGGSGRFPGAAIMAARAAARAGAGYVTLAVPEPLVWLAQSHLLEIPVIGLPAASGATFSEEGVELVEELAGKNSAVLVGPGMGVTTGSTSLCSALLECDVPLVMDADALNCLAQLTSYRLDNFPELLRRQKPVILTPHARELGRLVGLKDTPPDSLTSVLEAARRIVWADGGSELVIVAKGTATACVSVEAALLPKPGPAALATAGSGDVLAGILAAQLAMQAGNDSEDYDGALLAAYACEMHAYAGQIAAQNKGSRGVIASDLIESLGLAADALEDRLLGYGQDGSTQSSPNS
ncbi:MAG: NAD(P)H-hydrate dehydratase [Atopobiaceae bacterium]|nr:NAD(P)H-hydrate dehydratase [Atopobiaceae bacterium]